jgi:IS30 family transposase
MDRRTGKVDCRITDEDWAEIEDLIRREWSPEQTSGRLEEEENGSVSHEWIYQYVWAEKETGGDLWGHFRCDHPETNGKIEVFHKTLKYEQVYLKDGYESLVEA